MNPVYQDLKNYLPPLSAEPIISWLDKNGVIIKITRARKTKLGDFRIDRFGRNPQISINNNLNPYAFLITLVHEMAHLVAWQNKRLFKHIPPHGKEWKEAFSKLMQPFLNEEVFPSELLPAVQNYFKNPKASSVSDPLLMSAIKLFDPISDKRHLSDLNLGNRFVFRKTTYELKKKQRTRYQCQNIQNRRVYLIHGMAEVERVCE